MPREEALEGIDLGHSLLHLLAGPKYEGVIVDQEMQIWRDTKFWKESEISQQAGTHHQNHALRLGRARQ